MVILIRDSQESMTKYQYIKTWISLKSILHQTVGIK